MATDGLWLVISFVFCHSICNCLCSAWIYVVMVWTTYTSVWTTFTMVWKIFSMVWTTFTMVWKPYCGYYWFWKNLNAGLVLEAVWRSGHKALCFWQQTWFLFWKGLYNFGFVQNLGILYDSGKGSNGYLVMGMFKVLCSLKGGGLTSITFVRVIGGVLWLSTHGW